MQCKHLYAAKRLKEKSRDVGKSLFLKQGFEEKLVNVETATNMLALMSSQLC